MSSEPKRGLSRAVYRLRTQGAGWIGKRLASEVSLPTTGPGKFMHALARRLLGVVNAVPRSLSRSSVGQASLASDTLYAFYDLKVAPVTFDFLWFLAGAELCRKRLGLAEVHVVIVPGGHQGVRREGEDYEAKIGAAARRERVYNVLMASCPMLPSCTGVTNASSREQAAFLRRVAPHVYPFDYEPSLPVYPGPADAFAAARGGDRTVGALRATQERLDEIDRWIAAVAGPRRLVVITLRYYDYMTGRNSDVQAWMAFARSLDPETYLPIFIPDTGQTLTRSSEALSEFVSFPEAAWNVGLRMALYERAFVNLGVNTGPMGLCWLNAKTHYATFKMAVPNVPQTSLEYFRELGFVPGESLPFATATQDLIWHDDTAAEITRAFGNLTVRIETGIASRLTPASL
ncbi:MAG: hypothetical protein JSR72_10165 [Proteobacteria bacterium]|nr:hypothetical protein [Pseudomonadota bacterium]